MTELTDLVARAKAKDAAAERELCIRAGSGCIEAQRAIRDGLLAGLEIDASLVLSRIIAARGVAEDRHKLAASLFILAKEHQANGDPEAATDAAAESLAMFRDLSDEGDGRSLQALASMGPEFPAVMAALDCAPLIPDGPFVTEIPPPICTTLAPLALPDLTRRERFAIWCDDLRWRVRMKWWDFLDSLKGGC